MDEFEIDITSRRDKEQDTFIPIMEKHLEKIIDIIMEGREVGLLTPHIISSKLCYLGLLNLKKVLKNKDKAKEFLNVVLDKVFWEDCDGGV